MPSELHPLALHSPKEVYDTLFSAAWKTLEKFGRKKGVQMGMISVLHTWGQDLSLHPHLHCIVPGGGIDKDGNWKNIRADGKFLFHVKALGKKFRGKYVDELDKKVVLDKKLRNSLFSKKWVVYAKQPFGNSHSVVEYLGRYTHKIAISNHRIKAIDEKSVTFSYKDYKAKGEKKIMVLDHATFIRRFALHILPKRFVKMRHYGFLSSTWKRKKLKALQEKMQVQIRPKEEKKGTRLRKCPCCKTGNLVTILVFDKRGPPEKYMGVGQNSIPCEN